MKVVWVKFSCFLQEHDYNEVTEFKPSKEKKKQVYYNYSSYCGHGVDIIKHLNLGFHEHQEE